MLFVGLGVDFGIQYSVRYRAERFKNDDLRRRWCRAGRAFGGAAVAGRCATAAGFLSFLPTDYKGVSELGEIAGVGMIVAFTASITVLPAF